MFGGERPPLARWVGAIVAFGGLIWLLWPGAAGAPPVAASLLMAAAAIGWGVYSLEGRKAADPLAETGANFLCAAPFGLAVWLGCLTWMFILHLWLRCLFSVIVFHACIAFQLFPFVLLSCLGSFAPTYTSVFSLLLSYPPPLSISGRTILNPMVFSCK